MKLSKEQIKHIEDNAGGQFFFEGGELFLVGGPISVSPRPWIVKMYLSVGGAERFYINDANGREIYGSVETYNRTRRLDLEHIVDCVNAVASRDESNQRAIEQSKS